VTLKTGVMMLKNHNNELYLQMYYNQEEKKTVLLNYNNMAQCY